MLRHSYDRSEYPQDIELILSDGNSVYVGVAKLLSDGKCKLSTNHLSVF
ncbi:hypothetical protein LFX25_03960 [Leptospira sp. FAT2]|nr:hypothetical protein [Leptospira sanjuanensis]MCG6192392.1 hypothetical protein [Leptospira sanjuanensis]